MALSLSHLKRLSVTIVTGDETWCHHFQPESKRQSKQWKRVTSPPKKSKVVHTSSATICNGSRNFEHGSSYEDCALAPYSPNSPHSNVHQLIYTASRMRYLDSNPRLNKTSHVFANMTTRISRPKIRILKSTFALLKNK
ncbi:hypothetical protein TNCV_3987041 [Trichonephila clavipes]|nr:hypothetical protein TNCV_3987041 [Trichonephila clavipes]